MRRALFIFSVLLLCLTFGLGTYFVLLQSEPQVVKQEEVVPVDTAPPAASSTSTHQQPVVVPPPTPPTLASTPPARPITVPTIHESTPGPLIQPPPTSPSVAPPPATPTPTPPATLPTSSTQSATPSQIGELNQSGILKFSNDERIKAGLPPLTFSARLSSMAEGKVIDMITKQYFAHDSPDGITISLLAKKYGYVYLFVGENLALGDFDSSLDVVTGWMNSPGHRANILGKDFTEIGISALRGNYEGHEVWYAVQEFGKPMPVCPDPDTFAKQKIDVYESQLPTIEESIRVIELELKATNDTQTYNAKVKEYQSLVELYNTTVKALKVEIAAYNISVQAYNLCISG